MSTLPEDLECAAIGALLKKEINVDEFNPKILSKIGKFILEGYQKFPNPPSEGDILGLIRTTDSIDEASYIHYLKQAKQYAGTSNIKEIVSEWHGKQTLLEVQNEALRQMKEGFDYELFNRILTEAREGIRVTNTFLHPLSDDVVGDCLDPPVGVSIRSLPNLSETIGGIQGLMAIGGGPAVGKTTLATQLMVDWLREGKKVLYYDFENTSRELIRRVSCLCPSLESVRDTLKLCYYRSSIKTLSHDIETLGEDLLLIVDSFQKLPARINHKRESLEDWLHKFEEIKKCGISIIILSEVDKASYKTGRSPSMGDYKETGEVEYSVDTGLQLRESRYSKELIELWIVKCRARPAPSGRLELLTRESFGKLSEESSRGSEPQTNQAEPSEGWVEGNEW